MRPTEWKQAVAEVRTLMMSVDPRRHLSLGAHARRQSNVFSFFTRLPRVEGGPVVLYRPTVSKGSDGDRRVSLHRRRYAIGAWSNFPARKVEARGVAKAFPARAEVAALNRAQAPSRSSRPCSMGATVMHPAGHGVEDKETTGMVPGPRTYLPPPRGQQPAMFEFTLIAATSAV